MAGHNAGDLLGLLFGHLDVTAAAKVMISSWRTVTGTNQVSSTGQSSARGEHIPLGETIYYRAKCETAGSKTLNVHFRHFCHS